MRSLHLINMSPLQLSDSLNAHMNQINLFLVDLGGKRNSICNVYQCHKILWLHSAPIFGCMEIFQVWQQQVSLFAFPPQSAQQSSEDSFPQTVLLYSASASIFFV